jgi:hypothetical protein
MIVTEHLALQRANYDHSMQTNIHIASYFLSKNHEKLWALEPQADVLVCGIVPRSVQDKDIIVGRTKCISTRRSNHERMRAFHRLLVTPRVRVMVFNSTINKIAVKSWRSVLLVGETGMPGDNHRPAESHWKLYHIVSYRVHLAWGFKLTTLVVIWTDCIGSYKYNHHHMIRTTKAP